MLLNLISKRYQGNRLAAALSALWCCCLGEMLPQSRIWQGLHFFLPWVFICFTKLLFLFLFLFPLPLFLRVIHYKEGTRNESKSTATLWQFCSYLEQYFSLHLSQGLYFIYFICIYKYVIHSIKSDAQR